MLICKNCKIALEGNFCPQCGEKVEAVGIDEQIPTEEVIVENAVEDERMIPQPISEGEEELQEAETEEIEEVDPEAEALRIERERIEAENENKARICARFSVWGPILVIAASVVCCPVVNVVSIVLAIVALVKRSAMLKLFAEKRYEAGIAVADVMQSAFRWSWITLIISLVVGIIAFAVGLTLGGTNLA